jgi:hypothetical protein
VVAYLVLAILLIPNIFFKGLTRRVLDFAEEHPTYKILFAQNIEIIDAITEMPKVMWQLALVYLFQWYALFCYWQNSAKSIALSVYKTTPGQNPELYEKGGGLDGPCEWLVQRGYLSLCIRPGVFLLKNTLPNWFISPASCLQELACLLSPLLRTNSCCFLPSQDLELLGKYDGNSLPDGSKPGS